MCKIEDTIKIEDNTPKMMPSMMNYPLPIRDDSEHFLNSAKESQSFEDKMSLMKLSQNNEDY